MPMFVASVDIFAIIDAFAAYYAISPLLLSRQLIYAVVGHAAIS